MKISSVSKKVLASALSAAMVVAFAPTAAFAAIADFDASGTATGITDEKAIAAGYNFKSVAEGAVGSANAGKLVTTYYKASEIDGSVNDDLTMIADTDAQIVLAAGQDLDLNGHTLSFTKADAATDYALDVTAANTSSTPSVIKNGTIETVDYINPADGKTLVVVPGVNANYNVQLNNVNVDSIDGSATITAKGAVAVAGDFDVYTLILDKSAKVTSGAISIAAGGAGVKMGEASSLEAASSNKKGTATAIAGDVTMAKNAVLVATAETSGGTDWDNDGTENGDVDAIAIAGNVAMGTAEGASVTATAKTTGIVTDTTGTNTADAKAITGATKITVKKGQVLKATASVFDDDAIATAIGSDLETEAGATVEVAATASTETVANPANTTNVKDFALAANKKLTTKVGTKAATVKGYFVGAGNDKIEAGSYSMDPKPYVDATKFDITDSNGLFTVKQAEGFTIAAVSGAFGKTGEQNNIKAAVEAALDSKTGAAALSYAEGYDIDKVRALAAGGTLRLSLEDKTTTEKKATDAQKAALEAINAYAAKNAAVAQKIEDLNFTTAYLYFNDAENNNAVVKVADVTDFGATVGSRNSTPNTVSIDDRAISSTGTNPYADFVAKGKVVVTVDAAGNVTPVEHVKNTTSGNYEAKVTSAPVAYVVLPVDINAIKDGVTEQPETPAIEKATQGIDVSKKSRTVKIGSKTKTAKALYFKMGASAETELATAKKSGSSRITVSGDKVTLKKGTKKGTYTAKVSLKAAGSDEYLAAAKTITVKFVVKK